MSSLAASIGVAILGAGALGLSPVAVAQDSAPAAFVIQSAMPARAHSAWEAVKPSVAIILRSGIPSGQAALIDKSGLFLANQGAVSGPKVEARLSDGKVVVLDWKATDVTTQTVLLQAENWPESEGAVVALRQPGAQADKLPVIVVLPRGPVYGYLADGNKLGYFSPSKRAFPLDEVRFEGNTQSVAGALVFDESGHLVGILNATLETRGFVRIAGPSHGDLNPLTQGTQGFSGGGGGQAGGGDNQGKAFANPTGAVIAGPQDPTIGYTVGPEVLRRIVSGFLSPSHKVLHPAIGVQCRYSPLNPGAQVVAVQKDSPADHAGLLVGDLIVRMDDQPIRNQFDFSRIIESKDVGDTLTIGIQRFDVPHTIKVTVGTIEKVLVIPTDEVGLITIGG